MPYIGEDLDEVGRAPRSVRLRVGRMRDDARAEFVGGAFEAEADVGSVWGGVSGDRSGGKGGGRVPAGGRGDTLRFLLMADMAAARRACNGRKRESAMS